MIPEPTIHACGEGEILPSEAISAVSEAIRNSETGLAHPASADRFRTPTGNAGFHDFVSAPRSCSLTAAGRLPRSSSGVSDLCFGRTGRPKPERFGDSFWRWSRPCVVRTRPLPRRGYWDPRESFVHYQICQTQRRGRHTSAWRSSILVPPRPSSDVTPWIACF